MDKLQVVYKTVKDITPYENNPRNNDDAVQYVRNSIEEFGFKVPIIIDKNGVIIAGHTRFKAAKQIGMGQVPCVIADDLTKDKINAYRLADNKTQELSEWDWTMAGEELETIESIDMRLMGFAEFLDEHDAEELPKKKIGNGVEVDTDSFEDGAFTQVCPCCGFRFNE